MTAKKTASSQVSEERDDSRIAAIFADIAFSLDRVDYQIQPDYPGLTPEERKYLLSLRRQVKRMCAKVRQVGKL